MGTVGKLHILLRKIQFQLKQTGKIKQLLPQNLEFLRITATQLTDCQAMLGGSDRVDKVGYSLGLRKVETTVEKCPLSELASFGHTCTVIDKRLQQSLLHIIRSMARNLYCRFTGVSLGIIDSHHIVQLVETAISGTTRFKRGDRKMTQCDRQRIVTRESSHGDAAHPTRGGNSHYSIMLHPWNLQHSGLHRASSSLRQRAPNPLSLYRYSDRPEKGSTQ